MNCDEYYSYNALAGLVKNSEEEETSKKWDPWELVTEAVNRMKRNGDVMRSDRLKQVMQEIDSTFDEKDLGMAKFSRFVQDAVQRGLLSATKLENGQLEIGLPGGARIDARAAEAAAVADEASRVDGAEPAEDRKREGRGRRGRRGRGREREDRAPRAAHAADAPLDEEAASIPEARAQAAEAPALPVARPVAEAAPAPDRGARPERQERAPRAETTEQIGVGGERLTRDEAFDLVRRSVEALVSGDAAVRASAVRAKARELLGRDSESLSDRNFPRILKDAHDSDVIDLRRRGDDFEIARAVEAEPVSEQLAKTAAANAPAAPASPVAPRGMGPRGVSGPRGRGRPGAPPPDLLSIGVVGPAGGAASLPTLATPTPTPAAAAPAAPVGAAAQPSAEAEKPAARTRAKRPARKAAAPAPAAPAPTAAKKAAAKKAAPRKPRAKKVAATSEPS
jgi:hypothetical protein